MYRVAHSLHIWILGVLTCSCPDNVINLIILYIIRNNSLALTSDIKGLCMQNHIRHSWFFSNGLNFISVIRIEQREIIMIHGLLDFFSQSLSTNHNIKYNFTENIAVCHVIRYFYTVCCKQWTIDCWLITKHIDSSYKPQCFPCWDYTIADWKQVSGENVLRSSLTCDRH